MMHINCDTNASPLLYSTFSSRFRPLIRIRMMTAGIMLKVAPRIMEISPPTKNIPVRFVPPLSSCVRSAFSTPSFTSVGESAAPSPFRMSWRVGILPVFRWRQRKSRVC